MAELTEKQKKYREYFEKKLKEYGVKSPDDLEDNQKSKFYEDVDDGWKADNESDAELASLKSMKIGDTRIVKSSKYL